MHSGMLKTKTAKYAFLMLLISMLSACISENLIPSSIVLNDPVCEPPCWEFVEPGVTSKQEIIRLLNESSKIEEGTLSVKGENWNSFSDVISFNLTSGELTEIYLLADKASMISFSSDDGIISFGEAIENFGEPEYLLEINVYSDISSTYIFAMEPSKGIRFGYDKKDIPRAWRDELRSDFMVTKLDFFDPSVYDTLLDIGMLSMGLGRKETLQKLQPWVGYGSLEEKYHP